MKLDETSFQITIEDGNGYSQKIHPVIQICNYAQNTDDVFTGTGKQSMDRARRQMRSMGIGEDNIEWYISRIQDMYIGEVIVLFNEDYEQIGEVRFIDLNEPDYYGYDDDSKDWGYFKRLRTSLAVNEFGVLEDLKRRANKL